LTVGCNAAITAQSQRSSRSFHSRFDRFKDRRSIFLCGGVTKASGIARRHPMSGTSREHKSFALFNFIHAQWRFYAERLAAKPSKSLPIRKV